MQIAQNGNNTKKIYLEDYKKAEAKAKFQMNLEILKDYKISSELDLRLCQYLGRLNVPNTSETLLKKKGLLVGGRL